jgi:hypothetical protein
MRVRPWWWWCYVVTLLEALDAELEALNSPLVQIELGVQPGNAAGRI